MSAGEVRDAIETITKVLSEQPQKGRSKNPLATAALKTGLRFQIIGPNGEAAVTDMPPPLGGKGSAPPPGWLLRASLASCNATVIATRAAQLAITLKTLKVMSRVNRSQPPRPRDDLPTIWQARARPRPPHRCRDDAPRDGHALLAGAGRDRSGGAGIS